MVSRQNRITQTLLIAFALLLQADNAAKILEVTELSSDDFDETVKTQERVLVDFYAPWCGHCQDLEPEFKKAANDARAEELEVVFAKVDIIANPDLAKKYKVSSYPALHYFEDGDQSQTYTGARKANDILRWVRRQENPSVPEIQEVEMEDFLHNTKEGEFGLVARVKKNSVRHKAFVKAVEGVLQAWDAASINSRVVFLAQSADAKADALLVMHRPNFSDPDTERVSFTGAWSDANIVQWAKRATYPTIGRTFDVKKYKPAEIELLGGKGSVVVLLDDKGAISEEDTIKSKMREVIIPAAKAYPEWRFTFAEHSELIGRESEILGVRTKFEPQISVLQGQKRWVLEGADVIQNPTEVNQFLADVKSKKLKPRYKSAPKPENTVDPDGITVLTGNTFEEHVLDSKRDVFVFYYGPDCPHSKEMAPEWIKLAQKVSSNGWNEQGVVVAKMDGTANGCVEEVTEFPKLILYPAVSSAKKLKLKQKYRGKQRTADSFLDFLLENARNLEKVRDAAGEGKKGAFNQVERELQKRKKASQEL